MGEGSNPFVIYHQSSRGCSGKREEKEEEKEPDQIKFYGKDSNRQTLVHFTRKLNQEDIYLQQRCIEDRLLNPHGEEAEDVFIIPLNVKRCKGIREIASLTLAHPSPVNGT